MDKIKGHILRASGFLKYKPYYMQPDIMSRAYHDFHYYEKNSEDERKVEDWERAEYPVQWWESIYEEKILPKIKKDHYLDDEAYELLNELHTRDLAIKQNLAEL